MPRRATGTVLYVPAKAGEAQGHYRIRCTFPDGSRPWFDLAPGPKSPQAEARAKETAAAYSARARKEGLVLAPRVKRARGAAVANDAPEGETLSKWSERWFTARTAQGLENQDAERSRWRKWITSTTIRGRELGEHAIADITREDVEDLVAHLDAAVQAGECSWKTVVNAFGLASKAFSDASGAKDRSLRVRKDNPAAGVRPPDRGARKAKAWLHPREVTAVLANVDEPIAVRLAIALNVYLYTRPGELRALTWDDVDLDAGRVTIHHALRRDGTEKTTKTNTARSVPIEPTLAPLLAALREASGATGRVVEMPSDTALADVLRAALARANVKRPELFASSKTRKRVTWYDLRATGCTWRAIRGDNPIAIMHQAGHADFKTTQLYVREAQAVGGASFGDVFPKLPAELIERAASARVAVGDNVLGICLNEPKYPKPLWVDRDSNPGPED